MQRIKVKVGDFLGLSEEERITFLASQLDNELVGPLKRGVGRFEALLAPFNLSTGVDETVRRNILELQQIRNVIVHRNGRIDNRFLERCPWTQRSLGDLVPVSYAQFRKFYLSVGYYIMDVHWRVMDKYDDGNEEETTKDGQDRAQYYLNMKNEMLVDVQSFEKTYEDAE